MDDLIKKLPKLIGLILLDIFIGYLMLVFVYLIPNRWIEENARRSAAYLLEGGVYPSMQMKGALLDNWTDAECISVTFNVDSKNPFYNALNAFHKGKTDGVQRLYDTLYGTDAPLEPIDHSYLWHGFRIWLRPLLCLYELSDIRYLCFVITLILFSVLLSLLNKELGIWAVFPFFMSYLYFNFVVESVSLLFSNDISIMLLSCIGVIWAVKREKDLDILFALTGVAVAFSSMLIIPMITIGFPLIIWLLITEDKGYPVISRIFMTVRLSIDWFLGYALTLFAKIGIARSIISSSRGSSTVYRYLGATERLSSTDRVDRLRGTFDRARYISRLRWDVMVLAVIVMLFYIIILKKYSKSVLMKSIPYLIVASIPIIWVIVVAGHSHHFFTYFNFSIMLYAFLQSLCNICGRRSGTDKTI